MAINRVDITVADLGQLATVHVSELEDGANAWVSDIESYFVLVQNSGLTPDGTTIIKPLDGSPIAGLPNARWLRQDEDNSEDFINQPVWHINELTGNDQNDGKTALTALKTHAEFVRRVSGGTIGISMTVFIDSDLTQDLEGVFKFHVSPPFADGSINYFGVRTLLHAGTVTAHVDYNPATNTIGSITDAAIGSWGPFVGKLIVLTDRPSPQPAAWVAKDLGANAARTSGFFDFADQNTNPVNGEAYSVFSLTKITGEIRLSQAGGNIQFPKFSFNDLDLVDTFGGFFGAMQGQNCATFTCSVNGLWVFEQDQFFAVSSMFTGRKEIRSNAGGSLNGPFVACFFDVSQGNPLAFLRNGSTISVGGNQLVQGDGSSNSIGIIVQDGGLLRLAAFDGSANIAVADVDTAVVVGPEGSIFLEQNRLFGTGIAVGGILVDSGASVYSFDGSPAYEAAVFGAFFAGLTPPVPVIQFTPTPIFQAQVGSVSSTYAAVDAALAGAGGITDPVLNSKIVVYNTPRVD